jgi:catechol 2,3-dioxygenase-like lactoylglutathione lyase family enzyme
MNDRSPGLGRAHLCASIPTADLARAREFYGEVLGLRAHGPGDSGGWRMALGGVLFEAADGTQVNVYQRPPTSSPPDHTVALFVVDDLAAIVAELRTKGVPFDEYDTAEVSTVDGVFTGPGGFKVAWIRDPDGNIVALEQEPDS